jgi:hypothetical protein
LLLLVVIFGCNFVISYYDNDQQEATAKEAPMKATKIGLCEKIAEAAMLGTLSAVAVVAAAFFAATSG